MKSLLICGGVGGAKLAKGFYRSDQNFDLLVNVGDDFNHFGLHISPDLDTVMYTLSDQVNQKQGWGLKDESWTTLENIKFLNSETWFQLGDKDIATHMVRTQLLKTKTLTEATQIICKAFNLPLNIYPASNDPIETIILSEQEKYSFQEYFVKYQTKPLVKGIEYHGIQKAALNDCLDLESYDNIVICPSNPFLSIDPIIKIQELNNFLLKHKERVYVVSPIVANNSLKGPTAKIMQSLNIDVNVLSIAKHYREVA
ncbi:MAG: 2-phospho-L-lactate transferase, partial [Proteobacteria bacterium]|nr:2-phospho-L-lactate transferase [Pseudomonadota bacterium]